MEHKGGHWLVHEECIVRTAVCQNAHLGRKWCQTVKNQAHSASCYWVTLVWRHQSVSHLLILVIKEKIALNKLKSCRKFWKNFESLFQLNNTAPWLAGKMIIEAGFDFVAHDYSFIFPTMNHYLGSWLPSKSSKKWIIDASLMRQCQNKICFRFSKH